MTPPACASREGSVPRHAPSSAQPRPARSPAGGASPATGADPAGAEPPRESAAGRVKKRRRLALFSQILLGLIIVAELVAALWLPLHLRDVRLWHFELARHQTTMHLDRLRTNLWRFHADSPEENQLKTLLLAELNRMARYLRTAQEFLDAAQWRRFQDDLDRLDAVATRLFEHGAAPPLPEIDVEAAVRAALNRRGAPPSEKVQP